MNIFEVLYSNGIIVEELGLGENFYSYNITFDIKYSNNISRNIEMYNIDFFLHAAKNRAIMQGDITNFIPEPKVQQHSSAPYSFKINAPLPIVVYFAERIINI